VLISLDDRRIQCLGTAGIPLVDIAQRFQPQASQLKDIVTALAGGLGVTDGDLVGKKSD